MSVELPRVDPAYVASIVEALPARIAKKLGTQSPADWTLTTDGTRTTVTVGTATVTLTGPAAGGCDCLLAPQCLHLASVLTACPLIEGEVASPTDASAPAHEGEGLGGSATESRLDAAALEVVELAGRTLDGLVTHGLARVTAPDRSGVLRVVALARVQSLHRLAAVFGTLHERLAGDPQSESTIEALAGCTIAAQALSHHHATGTIGPEDMGTARRRHAPAGTLKLVGLACEPVVTDSGYAGVVTWLADADPRGEGPPRLWSLNQVTPGLAGPLDADGARHLVWSEYARPTGLPELNATHHDVARAGLLLAQATASPDGRLGKGRGVRGSLRTVAADDALAVEPAGWWCGRGMLGDPVIVRGQPRIPLHTEDGPRLMAFVPAVARLDPDIVRLVGGCAGADVDVRLRRDREAWTVLALRCEQWTTTGWIFPGLDRLTRNSVAHTWSREPEPRVVAVGLAPAAVVRRWRDRVARLGRRAVSGPGRTSLDRDIAWLDRHASPHRAATLRRLAEAADRGTRRFDGSFAPDLEALRPAWTAVAYAG